MGAGGAGGCVCSGVAPEGPNYFCSDGTIAGPVCGIDPSGACSWQVLGCPVAGTGGFASIGGAGSAGGSTGNTIACEYNGIVYGAGQSFPAVDGCNTCYCMSAGVACTESNCMVGAGGTAAAPTSLNCPSIDGLPNCPAGGELITDPSTGCPRYVCTA
jgi:hypothetical protein